MKYLNIYRAHGSGQPEQEAAHVLKEGLDAEGNVEISFDIPEVGWPGIWRTVTIAADGTVSIRDVPQASGMTRDETAFISANGGGEGIIPPPRWKNGLRQWTRPHFLKKRKHD